MSPQSQHRSAASPYARAIVVGFWSAALVILALLISLPFGAFTLLRTLRSPAVTPNAQLFAQSYTTLHIQPLIAGFLVLIGFVALVASVVYFSPRETRIYPLIGLGFAIVFAMLVSVNHMIQLVLVRQSVAYGLTDGLMPLAIFNPFSLFWALEMLGVGFQSLASLLIAPAFSGHALNRWIRWSLTTLGITGVLAAVLTMVDATWLLQPISLAGYLIWGLLFLFTTILLAVRFRTGSARR